jgi:hypothetical protein
MTSVFSSAFTILFFILVVIYNFKEINQEYSENTNNAILGSSFVGSLAYTFSDNFWFNAVEAEVYAMASLLISLLFWLG